MKSLDDMKINNKQYLLIFLYIVIVVIPSCNLERDVEIELPEYERQLVVECYLEPGVPYQLLLQESTPYLEASVPPLINDAVVTITHKGIKDTLKLNPDLDVVGGKIFNYISNRRVARDFINEFSLEITDAKGRKATAKTKLIEKVSIKEVTYNFNSDSSAYILTLVNDPPSVQNYYRFIVHKNNFSNRVQNFAIDDMFENEGEIPLGTSYDFKKMDTAIVSLYHIDKAYFDYLQSLDQARSANFNPFAQPSVIISNVKGGLGIFTAMSFDRKRIILY